VAADLWRALSEASGEQVEGVARAWIEQPGYPVVEIKRARVDGRWQLRLRQRRFAADGRRRKGASPRGAPSWPVPWVGRIGTGASGRGQLERRLLRRAREHIDLGRAAPRFVYGNADEGGFFRPLHGAEELRALVRALPSLAAVERMGLVDHQWALVRAGCVPIEGFLELAAALEAERDPDVLLALRGPLGFIADSLIPDAAPESEERFRAWVVRHFAPAFEKLGWKPAAGESDRVRLRRAALLGIAGAVAGSERVLEEAAARCDRYLANRRSLDPNLADGVVALAGREAPSGVRVRERPRRIAPGEAAFPARAGRLPRARADRANARDLPRRARPGAGPGLPLRPPAGEPGRPRAQLGVPPAALAEAARPRAPAARQPPDRRDTGAAHARPSA
jgi:puromycin-sensitive aminopeptidase